MSLLHRARSAITVSVSAILLFALSSWQPALALDRDPLPRTAPVSADSAPVDTTPLSERRDSNGSSAPQTVTAKGSVLAIFEASAPETTEEEVAKAHGLVIVSRLRLELSGKRIVGFRIPDARSVTEIVAALSADKRVTSAQPNFRYRLQDPSSTEIGSMKQPPRMGGLPEKTRASALRQGDGRAPTRMPAVRNGGSLVAGNQAALRWPSADEPFVNVGMRNR